MSKPRCVMGLKQVTLEPTGPWPKPKLKGRAAEGLRYQNRALDKFAQLAEYGNLYRDQWLSYNDTHGKHWCQPDAILDLPRHTIVAEVKLSLRREETGIKQLTKLYRPTVGKLFDKPVMLLLIFKHWHGESDLPLITDLKELLFGHTSYFGQPHGWHCFI